VSFVFNYLHRSRELHPCQAAKGTVANRDVLVKLFERIESFFERLKVYTKVPPSPAVTDELAKIMAEVLSILGIATKGIKEGRTSGFVLLRRSAARLVD
jgi:hypothetical protein